MNENTTTKGEKMDKERIAELRLLERHLRASGQMAGAVIGELLDALEAALARVDGAAPFMEIPVGSTVAECGELDALYREAIHHNGSGRGWQLARQLGGIAKAFRRELNLRTATEPCP